MLDIYNNIKKIFFKIILIFILINSNAYTEIISNFKITGNDRVSDETVIIFSELNINQNVSDNDLNSALINLYSTNYFKNVKINFNSNVVYIEVIENPIIQSIKIDGIKNKSILEELNKITQKQEKSPFLINTISQQKDFLLSSIKNLGFYNSEMIVETKDNRNNSVDIIYKFKLNERARISNIDFKGDKVFNSRKLRNIIKSEETKFWKFLSSDKYLSENRIELDTLLLKNFYLNNGYYDTNVKSTFATLDKKGNFNLTFIIDAGRKYYFNNVNLILPNEFKDDNFKKINKEFAKLKGKAYSSSRLEKYLIEINKLALQNEFLFVNTDYEVNKTNGNKIDIKIFFKELEKNYVERIDIFGNFITEEKVLRNKFIIDEGDAYNEILFNKSIDNIKSLGIFGSVNTNVLDSSENKNSKIIEIDIEEKPTGEIFAGAGAGSSGTSIAAGIKEKNYLGKGINLDTNINISDDQIKGIFSVISPNYRNTDKDLRLVFESTETDLITASGYKSSRSGFSVGTQFEQYTDLFLNIDLSTYYEKLETSKNASSIKKKQEGDYFENLISYGFTINKLDRNFQPSDGYLSSFNQILPIYSDEGTITNRYTFSSYKGIKDNIVLSGKLFLKSVNSLDENVRVSKRVYIPSNRLRGFESGKIGPKDGTQFIGGNYGTALNLSANLPNLISSYENLDFSIFLDAANLWHVDYDKSLDVDAIRSSTGISANWFTPVGPLTFSYSIPLKSESTDIEEKFRFQIGTSF